MKTELLALKTQIKTLAAEGTAIRARIRESSGRARYDAWNEKRAVGDEARAHLLAYALLRGRAYAAVESSTRAAPSPRVLHQVLAQQVPARAGEWSLEAIAAWLAVPPSPELLAQRTEAARQERDRRAAARARHAAGAA
jgi:hypothetical protein